MHLEKISMKVGKYMNPKQKKNEGEHTKHMSKGSQETHFSKLSNNILLRTHLNKLKIIS